MMAALKALFGFQRPPKPPQPLGIVVVPGAADQIVHFVTMDRDAMLATPVGLNREGVITVSVTQDSVGGCRLFCTPQYHWNHKDYLSSLAMSVEHLTGWETKCYPHEVLINHEPDSTTTFNIYKSTGDSYQALFTNHFNR